MSVYKCKMCGGNIDVKEETSIVTCDYCGSEQAITKFSNEKKLNLFNMAVSARLACNFDKALRTYEQILSENPDDAEAHWGMCLSRYGIEYVDDPKTKKKIPTCHRTIFNSIFDDIDYKATISNADVLSKKMYQDEAETIDKIQKNILSISQREEPYDIFICYKETDKAEKRTRDSLVAEDLYNELTKLGYKVFYARITLESKLGSQYEPIIFAALQSSKVMLVVGSKPEYFNAVWVKNEWSRFLMFMQENPGNKYLIPCYRDMDAYEMPDEFLPLQAQNLDRLGAKQDIIRGINKIFGKDSLIQSPVYNSQDNYVMDRGVHSKLSNLIKRGNIMLEDHDFDSLRSLCERILDEEAECTEAYEFLLYCDFEKNYNELLELPENVKFNSNFQKVIKFGDDENDAKFH